MKSQIELESVETELKLIKTLMAINGIPNNNIPLIVLECVKIAGKAVTYLDNETLEQVFNLKKTID
jgi:hypothetical protein